MYLSSSGGIISFLVNITIRSNQNFKEGKTLEGKKGKAIPITGRRGP
jgi:hypothetical protein